MKIVLGTVCVATGLVFATAIVVAASDTPKVVTDASKQVFDATYSIRNLGGVDEALGERTMRIRSDGRGHVRTETAPDSFYQMLRKAPSFRAGM